jgi:hypothetical protein
MKLSTVVAIILGLDIVSFTLVGGFCTVDVVCKLNGEKEFPCDLVFSEMGRSFDPNGGYKYGSFYHLSVAGCYNETVQNIYKYLNLTLPANYTCEYACCVTDGNCYRTVIPLFSHGVNTQGLFITEAAK